jgi:hypothetical protein
LVGRNAAQDDAGRFAAGVRVNDGDAGHEGSGVGEGIGRKCLVKFCGF